MMYTCTRDGPGPGSPGFPSGPCGGRQILTYWDDSRDSRKLNYYCLLQMQQIPTIT